jgi:hypothetical protein
MRMRPEQLCTGQVLHGCPEEVRAELEISEFGEEGELPSSRQPPSLFSGFLYNVCEWRARWAPSFTPLPH